jgi:hypothetical protein
MCNTTSQAFLEFFSMDLDHFKLDPPTAKTPVFCKENPSFDTAYTVSLLLASANFLSVQQINIFENYTSYLQADASVLVYTKNIYAVLYT